MTATVAALAPMVVAPRRTGWSSCTADFDDGGGAQTWTGPSAASDVLSVLENLDAWLTATFAIALTIEVTADTPPSVTLTPDAGVTINNASATAQALLGWPAGLGAFDGVYSVAGLWTGRGGLTQWRQFDDRERRAAAQGAASPRPPGTAPFRPELRGAVTAAMSPYLLLALQSAASPRVARVWDPGDASWRTVSLGPVSVARSTPALHTLTAEVLG